jgi:hypothetical protein
LPILQSSDIVDGIGNEGDQEVRSVRHGAQVPSSSCFPNRVR